MLTKNELKSYSGLLKKRQRLTENKFIVEGRKILEEAISSGLKCEIVCTTNQFSESNPDIIQKLSNQQVRIEIIKRNEIERLSDAKTPQEICGIFHIPQKNENISSNPSLVVMLDNINDPGNVGTIIRTCDWFGLRELVLSCNSADVYNPKVIRSTMGSLFHLQEVRYAELTDEILRYKQSSYKILLADLAGESIYEYGSESKSVIIFSSEAHGPTKELIDLVDGRITIPGSGSAESLNVASAAAIILSELTRSTRSESKR